MSDVAVLGLGAMGSRMAARILAAGHRVTVWTRTPGAAAEALVEAGADLAHSPREAAARASFVLAMVRDDEASRHVWLDPERGALAALPPGTVAIESSTLSPRWIRELGNAAAVQGIALLEAPVSGSRPQAEAGQLVFLVGGDEAIAARAESLLRAMGGAIHLVGPLGAGALVKLSTNTILATQVAVVAELIGLLKRSGADVGRALAAIASTPVSSPALKRYADATLAGDFAPQFPVELVEKDLRYALEVAGSVASAPVLAAALGAYQAASARGLGGANLNAVAQLYSGE